MIEEGVVAIDENSRRRAQISSLFYARQCHVEVFESVSDYKRFPIKAALYLVHDEDNAVKNLIEFVQASDAQAKIVGYTESVELKRVVEAMASGASDFVEFPFSVDIVERMRAIMPSRESTNRLAVLRERAARACTSLGRLTDREYQVLMLMSQGHSNKEIARHLCISHRTVEIHRANLMLRLGAKSSAEVLRLAFEADLAEAISPAHERAVQQQAQTLAA